MTDTPEPVVPLQSREFRLQLMLMCAVLACAAAAGCATRDGTGSALNFSVNKAALLGTQIDEFVLPDGGTGTIRKLGSSYSLKLSPYSRVVDIPNATSLTFRSSQVIDGYTLVVLGKSEIGCALKTQLLAIRGAEVKVWDFGDCKTWPVTTHYGNALAFDLAEGNQLVRYQFSGGRLTTGVPEVAPASQGLASPGIRPAAPSGSQTAEAGGLPKQSRDNQPPVAKRAPNPQPNLPTAPLIFKPREQAPRTIVLDKQ